MGRDELPGLGHPQCPVRVAESRDRTAQRHRVSEATGRHGRLIPAHEIRRYRRTRGNGHGGRRGRTSDSRRGHHGPRDT
jgi:hypothetical protein